MAPTAANNQVLIRTRMGWLLKNMSGPRNAIRVPVQIGAMNDRFVEITGGLVGGDEVVTTGAYSLGFASPSGFCYAFRRATGETPRQFRQRVRRTRG